MDCCFAQVALPLGNLAQPSSVVHNPHEYLSRLLPLKKRRVYLWPNTEILELEWQGNHIKRRFSACSNGSARSEIYLLLIYLSVYPFCFSFVFSTCLNCYEAPMRRQRRGERSEGLQQDPTARRSLWGVQGGDAKELEAKIRASRRISRWCWTSSSSLRLCKTWSRRLGVMRVVEKEIRHDRWGTWWPIQGRRNVSSCHYGYNNELTAWI